MLHDNQISVQSGSAALPCFHGEALIELTAGIHTDFSAVHAGFVNNLTETTLRATYGTRTVRYNVCTTQNGTKTTMELPMIECGEITTNFKGANTIFLPGSKEMIQDNLR